MITMYSEQLSGKIQTILFNFYLLLFNFIKL